MSTLVSQCLTSHVLKQTLILAKTLTSDPYKPGPLKIRLSVLCHNEIRTIKLIGAVDMVTHTRFFNWKTIQMLSM